MSVPPHHLLSEITPDSGYRPIIARLYSWTDHKAVEMASKLEPYKTCLRELYLDRRKTVEEVMSFMKMEHGFSASKPTYERQLKKWNFKKNMNESLVKFVKVDLQKRKREFEETEVYFHGALIPKSKIQKKVDRCFISTLEQCQSRSDSPPEELLIITPASEYYMACVKSKQLPWMYFRQQLSSFGDLSAILVFSGDIMRCMIPKMCPNPSSEGPGCVQGIIDHLCAIMPVDRDDNVTEMLQKIFGANTRQATTEFLKLAVYLISNKLLGMVQDDGPGTIFSGQLIKWFQMGQNRSFLRTILSNETPTIQAFMEAIFPSALQAEDLAILKDFLQSGINPDIVVLTRPDYFRRTPLSFAVQRVNLPLVQIFLEAGSDVDGSWCGATPLEIAAQSGNLSLVRLLVSRGASINRRSDRGYLHPSALQRSALAGSLEIASFLLDNGAEIDANHGNYGCALECAIRAEATPLVDMLLERGANVNCLPGEHGGNTPLQSAALIGDFQLVQRLLALGGDVNCAAVEVNGRTALQWASGNGDLSMCQALIQAGADVNAAPCARWRSRSTTALVAAVESESELLVRFLLGRGADINDRRGARTALATAAALGDATTVRLLLEAGADPGRNPRFTKTIHTIDNSALLAAVDAEDVAVVQILLNAGACPNTLDSAYFDDYDAPLVKATRLQNHPLVEILLQAGALCNMPPSFYGGGLTPLQAACKIGNVYLVRLFLSLGADVNEPAGPHGRTALQAAVESRNLELIQFLIENKADVNAPVHRRGRTALQAAVLSGRIDLVQLLLDAGAHVNDFAPGLNPLQRAAWRGDIQMVKMLLGHSANVNTPSDDCDGRTALQAASESGSCEIVQLLLNNRADINAPPCPKYGYSALQAAASRGNFRIAKILLNEGANVDAPGSIKGGRTALEAAAERGRIDMLKLLFNHGADITRTVEGRRQLRNAMEYATEDGHDAVAKFLKHHQMY